MPSLISVRVSTTNSSLAAKMFDSEFFSSRRSPSKESLDKIEEMRHG